MTNVQNVRQMPATFGMKFGTAKRFGNTTLGSLGIWISKMFPSCWSLQRLLYMVLEKYKVSAVSDVIHIAGLVECINNWRNIVLFLGKWSKEMTTGLCLGLKYQFCNEKKKKNPASLTNKCFNSMDLASLTVSEPRHHCWEFGHMLCCCFPWVHADLCCSQCPTFLLPLSAQLANMHSSFSGKSTEWKWKENRMKGWCSAHSRHEVEMLSVCVWIWSDAQEVKGKNCMWF